MDRQLLRWAPAFVLAATVLYTISVYPDLPARMPTHWGINGQPNGWSTRERGAWVLPGVMVFVWLLSAVAPRLAARRANGEKLGVGFNLVITSILAFEGLIQWAMLNVALGHPVPINTVVFVGLGALFVTIGLALPSRNKAARYLVVVAGLFTICVSLLLSWRQR
jgi:uncharacterized membrane protein